MKPYVALLFLICIALLVEDNDGFWWRKRRWVRQWKGCRGKCHVNAKCEHRRCVCKTGFSGDGINTCKKLPTCEQPCQKGRCRGYFKRYYFNQQKQSCELFVYGGCGGNQNNFKTLGQCQSKCEAAGKCSIQVKTTACEVITKLSGECHYVHDKQTSCTYSAILSKDKSGKPMATVTTATKTSTLSNGQSMTDCAHFKVLDSTLAITDAGCKSTCNNKTTSVSEVTTRSIIALNAPPIQTIVPYLN